MLIKNATEWNSKYKIGDTVYLYDFGTMKYKKLQLKSDAFIDRQTGKHCVFLSDGQKVEIEILKAHPDSFSLEEQIREVKREIGKREKFYPRWVAAGKLDWQKSRLHLAIMKDVLKTLEAVKEKKNPQTNLFGE